MTTWIHKVGDVQDPTSVFEKKLIVSAVRLARRSPAFAGLKIANAAMKEMRRRSGHRATYRADGGPRSSARPVPDATTRLYEQTAELERQLAAAATAMVITGAGPEIMEEGTRASVLRTPSGESRPPVEAATRSSSPTSKARQTSVRLTAQGDLRQRGAQRSAVPGGVRTLDGGFELLTLVQNGKAPPRADNTDRRDGRQVLLSWVQFFRSESYGQG